MSLPIEITDLDVVRSDRAILRGFNLTVAAGERLAITGPSGVGKSTLLLAIAGLLRPAGGQVRLGGDVVSGPSAATALMQQRPALLPWATASENVGLALQFAGASKAARRARAVELLAQVGLAERADDLPHTLSGGQQQRVALARALAHRPGILLLDEPFSALDPAMRSALRSDIARMSEADGVTVLLVTHDQGDADALCRRHVSLTPPGSVKSMTRLANAA